MTPILEEVEYHQARAPHPASPASQGRSRKAWRMNAATMTDADKNIAAALKRKLETEHRGRRRAMRGEDLAKHFHVPYNTIRQCVFFLVRQGVPIGTVLSGKPRGYYLIETLEEAQHSLAIPRARATENWAYHHALALAVQRALNLEVEQLVLVLGV
jgi:hypothetical protein